jgi:hypothetical protein
VRAELAAHAAYLATVISDIEKEVNPGCWQHGYYDNPSAASSTYKACSDCVDSMTQVETQAGGTSGSQWNPACEILVGTQDDMNTRVQRDAMFNQLSVYAKIGLVSTIQLRDLVVAASQPGFYGAPWAVSLPEPRDELRVPRRARHPRRRHRRRRLRGPRRSR